MTNELKPWADFRIDDDLITVTSGIGGLEDTAMRITKIQVNLQEKAVHEALAQKGLCIVPVEPNEAQQIAGADAVRFETTLLNKFYMANEAYRAMIKAAQEQGQ